MVACRLRRGSIFLTFVCITSSNMWRLKVSTSSLNEDSTVHFPLQVQKSATLSGPLPLQTVPLWRCCQQSPKPATTTRCPWHWGWRGWGCQIRQTWPAGRLQGRTVQNSCTCHNYALGIQHPWKESIIILVNDETHLEGGQQKIFTHLTDSGFRVSSDVMGHTPALASVPPNTAMVSHVTSHAHVLH